MTQINFRISKSIQQFLDLKANLEKITRTAVAHEIFVNGLEKEIMPYLANLYKENKLTLKKIASLLNLHFTEVMDLISQYINDIKEKEEIIAPFPKKVEKLLQPMIQNAKTHKLTFNENDE